MNRREMTVGQRIVDLLVAEGVSTIFSQGDLSMRDIQKHAEARGLRIVGPRHEAAAVFMADAYYRVCGIPQVAMGAMGPGQANLLPATVCAAQEHIPVIVIGSRRQGPVNTGVRRGRFLHAPVFDCFKSICKFAGNITHPAETDEIVEHAFRQALTGTPGPVYIEYDFVMHEQMWPFPEQQPPARYRVTSFPAPRSVLESAVKMLRSARCPILIGGTGIHTSGAYDVFMRLARSLNCPVLTTIGGSGTLPETDPQWLAYYSESGREALEHGDVILAIGTSFPETLNYAKYRHFSAGPADRKWILVEQDISAVGVNRPIDLPIVGRMQDVLPELCDLLEQGAPTSRRNERLESWRLRFERERESMCRSVSSSEKINPSELMLEARKAIPDEATIVIDSGLTLMHQIAYFEKRARRFLWTSKYGHLGSGIPYAIGAQLALGNNHPVCLITGDGGMGFHIMEFETAVRHRLPIVIVINDDRALGAEMEAHMQHIGHTIEVSFSPVRYDGMATAMGGYGEYVDTVAGIAPAISRALAQKRPAIVQVAVDPESALNYAVPLRDELSSWLFEDPTQAMSTD